MAQKAGFTYNSESLQTVLGAVRNSILSDVQICRLYEAEYKNITPSTELCELFKYTWRRIYTWCIDDALDNVLTKRVQRLRFINGIHQHVVEDQDLSSLQIVKLHGDILNPSYGFIMTEAEYANVLTSDKHAWYRKLAQDYIAYTPIFIGSRINEPILTAELERIKKHTSSDLGRAFLISPDVLSPITISNLNSRGITHIR